MDNNERQYKQYCKLTCTTADAAREIWTEFCGILNEYREKNEAYDILDPPGTADLNGTSVEFIAYHVSAPLFVIAKKYSAYIENLDMYGW